jgi:hypothetical protein
MDGQPSTEKRPQYHERSVLPVWVRLGSNRFSGRELSPTVRLDQVDLTERVLDAP